MIEPTTLDPALASDIPTTELLLHAYMPLVGWAEDGAIVPAAAKELPTVTSGGTIYTFTLRSDLRFHNGRTVTAEDVRYSLTRSLQKELASPLALNYLGDIVGAKAVFEGATPELDGVEVLDGRTVRITIDRPRPYFLGKLTYSTGAILAREEVEKGPKTPGGAFTIGAENMATVGCGPFKLVRYTRQDKLVLEANADFVLGKPKLTRIERPIVLDAKAARMLYDTGQVDLINLEKGDYEKDRNDPALKDQIHFFNRAGLTYLALNQTHYLPFRDRRVRIAVAHAIDKDAIIRNVLLGVHRRAECVLPEGLVGHQADFKGYPYDPSRARELLVQAGYPDGEGLPPLTLYLQQLRPDLIRTAQVIQEQLATIGIRIGLKEMEWGALLSTTANRELDLFLNGWTADYLDPQNFLSLLFQSGVAENRTNYANTDFDRLCARADTEMNVARRLALYHQAERLLVDDAPWIPLFFDRAMELIRPHVHGVRDSLMGHLPHTGTRVG